MTNVATRVLEARGVYGELLNRQALRRPTLGLVNAAKMSNLLQGANLDLLENSWNKPGIAIPVMNRLNPTVNSGLTGCAMGSLESDTALYSVNFIEGNVKFDWHSTEADNNILSEEMLFAQKLFSAEFALARFAEGEIFNVVDTNKGTTYNSGLVGTGNDYPLVGDALQVSSAFHDRFFYDFPSIMLSDDFDDSNLDVIGSPELSRYINYNSNQGQANNQNLAAQYDSYDYNYSRFITRTGATNAIATGFVMPKNTIGYVSRAGGSYRKGDSIGDEKEWGTMYSDLMGIDLMVYRVADCADGSARNGNARDISNKYEQWAIQFSLAVFTPYQGGDTNTGIKKFDIIT